MRWPTQRGPPRAGITRVTVQTGEFTLMPILCGCPHCQAKFRIAEKFAGRRIKCPKCAEAILVDGDGPPSAGDSGTSGSASAVSGSAASARSRAGDSGKQARRPARPPATRGEAPRTRRPAERKEPAHPAEPTVEDEAVPTASAPAAAAGGAFDFGSEPGVAARSRGGRRAPRRKKSKSSDKGRWLLVGGGAIGVILLLAAGVYLATSGGKEVAGGKQGKSGAIAGPKGKLVLDWSDNERQGAAVHIDGERKSLPNDGPVEFELPAGSHKLVILRRGYEQIEVALVVPKGEQVSYSPKFDRSFLAEQGIASGASYQDWLQDFRAAQLEAAREQKDVLLLFAGTDWNSESMEFGDEVSFHKDFRTEVGDQYVLALVDFPRGPAARESIEDPSRNEQLQKHFNIHELPTIVLTDPRGWPYAVGQYAGGGLPAFTTWINEQREVRQGRDELLDKVEEADEGARLEAAAAALTYLEEKDLEIFYGSILARWYALAGKYDGKNEQGLNEQFFEADWKCRIVSAMRRDNPVAELAGELDKWKKTHEFQDADRAARLHLQAAWMVRQSDPEAVGRYARDGLAYGPSDRSLKSLLSQLQDAAGAANVLGSGSGFAVDSRGYFLTNHHVIEGAGAARVVLTGREEPLPAKIVAQDAELDLALLKVELPEGFELKAMPVTVGRVGRGTRVGAFGFPLGDVVGKGLKLTIGIVSATHEQTQNGMMLLDCRVNPGNSGGPLCSTDGSVVGIVTAKSYSSADVESYGMAVPGKFGQEFLGKHLPGYTPPEESDESPAPREWDVVDREVSPSVVMILKVRDGE